MDTQITSENNDNTAPGDDDNRLRVGAPQRLHKSGSASALRRDDATVSMEKKKRRVTFSMDVMVIREPEFFEDEAMESDSSDDISADRNMLNDLEDLYGMRRGELSEQAKTGHMHQQHKDDAEILQAVTEWEAIDAVQRGMCNNRCVIIMIRERFC